MSEPELEEQLCCLLMEKKEQLSQLQEEINVLTNTYRWMKIKKGEKDS